MLMYETFTTILPILNRLQETLGSKSLPNNNYQVGLEMFLSNLNAIDITAQGAMIDANFDDDYGSCKA